MRLSRQQQEAHQIAERIYYQAGEWDIHREGTNATILVVNPPRERPMA